MPQKDSVNGFGVVFGGQGTQEPEMFKELAHSKNPYVRKAAEVVLDTLKKLPGGRDIRDVYYNSGVDPIDVNDTKNVQPGLVAQHLIFYLGMRDQLGFEPHLYAGSGYSLGVISSLFPLGVLLLEDVLYIPIMRGVSMSLIRPGQFYVKTVVTKEPVNVRRMNWTRLKGTHSRVSIRHFPNLLSISGPLRTREKVERRLERSELVVRELYVDPKKFYLPFHNSLVMKSSATFFRDNLIQYCQTRKEETGEDVFKDLEDGLFVTNAGKILRRGEDIRDYIGYPHIVKLCDFYRTMKRMGRLVDYCIGFGIDLKRYVETGCMENFYPVTNESDVEGAARWYETMMKKVKRILPERIPKVGVVPSYN